MAFALQFNGTGYVHTPTLGNALNASTVKVSSENFTMRTIGSAGYWVGQASSTAGTREFGFFSFNGSLQVVWGGSTTDILTNSECSAIFGTTLIESDLFEVELDVANSTYEIFSNGASIKSGSFSKGTGRVEGMLFMLGARSNSNTAGNTTGAFIATNEVRIGNTKLWIDGNLVRNYVSTGTGSEWSELVSSADGTLLNFPTDDSQWVFYESGGAVESTVAATWPLFQAQASQSSTIPDITSGITAQWPIFGVSVSQGAQVPDIDSTIAAAWPLFTVQANQASGLPQYQATIATDWPMFSASVSQQSEAPQYTADLAATWPLFTVSAEQVSQTPAVEITAAVTWPLFSVAANQESQLPEGATSIAVTWPLFSVDVSQQSTVPEFDSTIAATWPLFQVSASQQQELPSGATAIAVEWPMFGVQASQESIIPEFTATVAATWPLFSVSILAGEFEFFASPQARVDIPNLSRRVDIPSLSRRIDI